MTSWLQAREIQGAGRYCLITDKCDGSGLLYIDQAVHHLKGRIDASAKCIHPDDDKRIRLIWYVQGSFETGRHTRVNFTGNRDYKDLARCRPAKGVVRQSADRQNDGNQYY